MRKGGFAAIGAIILGTAGPAAAQGIPVYASPGYFPAHPQVKNNPTLIEQGQEANAERQEKRRVGEKGRIRDWSSDVCSSDLPRRGRRRSRKLAACLSPAASVSIEQERMSYA